VNDKLAVGGAWMPTRRSNAKARTHPRTHPNVRPRQPLRILIGPCIPEASHEAQPQRIRPDRAAELVGDPLATAFGSGPAEAGIGADPQYPIRGVPRQLDDLVLRHAGHGRACDRSGEPVPRFDELVLGLAVAVDRVPEPSAVMTGSMPPPSARGSLVLPSARGMPGCRAMSGAVMSSP